MDHVQHLSRHMEPLHKVDVEEEKDDCIAEDLEDDVSMPRSVGGFFVLELLRLGRECH